MKARLALALVAILALGGCANGGPANPNLAAPKVVVHARPDGDVSVFLHGAFGDRLYDWIALDVDNETRGNRTAAFSLEERINATGFYLEAAAGTPTEVYTIQARVDVDAAEERVIVAVADESGEWDDPQSYGLPFERVLTRRAQP